MPPWLPCSTQRWVRIKPHGKGRWESLYFDYPEFEAPARDGLAMRATVTIVGAGPEHSEMFLAKAALLLADALGDEDRALWAIADAQRNMTGMRRPD